MNSSQRSNWGNSRPSLLWLFLPVFQKRNICSHKCDNKRLITSLTSADTDLSAGRRLGSSSRTLFLKVIEGCTSCSGPEASGIQLARPALVLRSVRLRGGLLRMSRSALRLRSSDLFGVWLERSSGLFHTPSVTCLYIQGEYKRLQYTQDTMRSWTLEEMQTQNFFNCCVDCIFLITRIHLFDYSNWNLITSFIKC